MGKRSSFERVEKDFYRTIDKRAVQALVPHLKDVKTFIEPCCGELDLVNQLQEQGLVCEYWSDISLGNDALQLQRCDSDAIITNPPWSRPILHQMIDHFSKLAPTWLLFDADWMHTKQSVPFMPYCTDIVSIGRLTWIPGTSMVGKDNCCWYRFDQTNTMINKTIFKTNTKFHGRV